MSKTSVHFHAIIRWPQTCGQFIACSMVTIMVTWPRFRGHRGSARRMWTSLFFVGRLQDDEWGGIGRKYGGEDGHCTDGTAAKGNEVPGLAVVKECKWKFRVASGMRSKGTRVGPSPLPFHHLVMTSPFSFCRGSLQVPLGPSLSLHKSDEAGLCPLSLPFCLLQALCCCLCFKTLTARIVSCNAKNCINAGGQGGQKETMALVGRKRGGGGGRLWKTITGQMLRYDHNGDILSWDGGAGWSEGANSLSYQKGRRTGKGKFSPGSLCNNR